MSEQPNTALPVQTSRQQDVLDRIVAGRSDRQIASELNIAVETVTTHVRAISAAWGVGSRRELRRAAADRAGAQCSSCAWKAEAQALHDLLNAAGALLAEINAEFLAVASAGRASRG